MKKSKKVFIRLLSLLLFTSCSFNENININSIVSGFISSVESFSEEVISNVESFSEEIINSSSEEKTYTVTWLDWDGTVLELDENVKVGSIPSYDSETPTRESDLKYDYYFSNWTPDIKPVNEDVVYTATYSTEALITLDYQLSDDGTYYIVKGIGTITNDNVVIPSYINNLPVCEIAPSAFSGCENIISIEIPETITKIGDYAFEDCSKLSYIEIPETVVEYGAKMLKGCKSLNKLEIPYLTTNVYELFGSSISFDTYNNPMVNNEGYEIITYTKFEYSMNDGFFEQKFEKGEYYYYPSLLKEITIRRGEIPNKCFYDNILEKITIEEEVTDIGSYAFSYCDSLVDVTIPSTITSIGDYVFYNCSSLKTITFEEGSQLTSIGTYAFYGCSSLTSITIPSSVTSIGWSAFSNCKSLTSIVIPSSVTSIGFSAFSGCSSLESITLPFVGASATSIEYEALFGYIFGTNSYTGGTATKQFYSSSSSNTYYIPSSLKEVIITGGTTISYGAFYDCDSLTSITIPNSVVSIGRSAFYGCSSLTNVYYSGTIEDWCNITFSLASSNPMYYASYFYMLDENNEWYEVTRIEIPNIVTSIGNYQFCGFNNVTEIIIPNSVTSIGNYAFYSCSSLTTIEMSNNVTSIGDYAFRGCSSLTSITFEEGSQLTSIGDYAFEYCSSLTSITIPNSVTSIGEYAFRGCTSLESITLPFVGQNADGSGATHFGYIFGASSYSSNSSYVPSSLKEVIITGGTTISYGAFYNCSSLTSITIPSSITSIGDYAFYKCSSLTIYCEVSSKPSGWSSSWNYENRPVYWGCQIN